MTSLATYLSEVKERAKARWGVGVKTTDIPALIRALEKAIEQRDEWYAFRKDTLHTRYTIDGMNDQILAVMKGDV